MSAPGRTPGDPRRRAGGGDYASQFTEGEGLSFEIHGERAGDVSTRMAGPEIKAIRVVLTAEGGPAQ